MGRKKTTDAEVVLYVRLPTALRDALAAEAEAADLALSQLVRRVLREHVAVAGGAG